MEKVQPVFDKYNNLYLPNYSYNASLGYPLYYSKYAFKANKIFDIVYLKEAIEKMSLLVHLETIVDDL